MTAPIVIAAGGTGGHFFPAEALATELAARGHALVLMTDGRAGRRTQGVFANTEQHVLAGSGIAGHGIGRKLGAGVALGRGTMSARSMLARLRPAAVVGFGGYPSVPPLLGARLLGSRRPVIILHEGNAVLGQANAQLARFADAIATSFPLVARLPSGANTVLTGMPVRAEIAAAANSPYPSAGGELRLLVWGGSLGARVFSDIVPQTLAALPELLRLRLSVTQQARAEDVERVRAAYAAAGICAEVAPFFDAVAKRLADSHLVIGRAGGSSVAELTMVGRPSIMVPLPIAASDEQGANAASLIEAGGGWMLRQPDFTPAALGLLLAGLLGDPARLAAAATASAGLARHDAARRLADLVESTVAATASTRLRPAAEGVIPAHLQRDIPARSQREMHAMDSTS
ncbi:undecaprenyldiphospho-muramoylpentapeptide beta-N-acetylglucosaminyltransferase [Lichenicola cladoniae]|uniref:UDP-N-acetylglucosamine--N-acetylmuramyl-(pentapeptide) pyrophosphoryl-undecaprenol N-acetylglucosamine transferase n=1 Tax=Lichenicola cladoniae TaxID=1484109 RepID=A0A6M8HS49_9PROT|nr:undecaprenyldiphospho-muramoylpentapeptide beta-N-acetylglucosaminyltransferase [Lichenicola cladoniae]NPD65998.1 undecaprenyldiphospho-muramoylpentapeptide beta-N-acetylglucosaminyltransferase [Acetobacteraceae bacterium]QKE91021.1 undecaprenyldiphospho-muramoylpentapeptide beta-N-acetylglucosaminyltransferase [Lichenicola cladoniae]